MSIGEGWDVPPGSDPWSDFHWFRVSPRTALVVIVLSEKPLWYAGHFMDTRMWPCTGRECELCRQGVGGQVRYVLGCAEVGTHRVGILEVGRSNGELIRSWVPRRDGLRGMQLELTKHSLAKGSRTQVRYIDSEAPPWWRQLPSPDVREALMMTWKKAGMPLPLAMRE